MALDLRKVRIPGAMKLIEPRDIYAALPNRPWPYLRHEQGEVLEKWFEARTQRDVVIKQNTGGGKTAVGLLIAQSALNEGVGPAIYLASDSYLVDQVVSEASGLGLAVTDDPRSPEFIGHEAILVTTFQRLVNGESVFGVDGTHRPTVHLGTIVIDDAHAALATTESQFALTIKNGHSLYEALRDLFERDLVEQSESTFRDIKEGSGTALLRIPFWSWRDKQSKVLDLIQPHVGEDALKFQWPLIRDQLEISTVTITGWVVDIRPPATPIHKLPAFHTAARRVYLTATLADDGVLVQDLAASPTEIATAITPGRASDIGDRIILAPLELNASLSHDSVRKLAANYAHGWPDQNRSPTRKPINVVVLVPSDKAAKVWNDVADETWNVKQLIPGVAKLKQEHVGLVVLANKYDGIDLAGTACELLVVDGLPVALDSVERREASALVKSHKVLARQVQRVEQGMGRGVRDGEDHCGILLLGNSLTKVIHDPRQRSMFSPATQAQIELSRNVAQQLRGASLDDIREALDLCILRSPGWIGMSREALATTNYNSAALLRPSVLAERAGFDKAVARNFTGAAAEIQAAVNGTSDPAERGWLMEKMAVYQDMTNPGEAQKTLVSAMTYNHHVLHPIAGVAVEKLKPRAEQAAAIVEHLRDSYIDRLDALLGIHALFDRFEWNKETADQDEAAWADLGLLLGFSSERPEQRYGKGPDNLWVLTTGTALVTELKTGAEGSMIAKSDVDQLGGHVRWFEKHYGHSAASVPVMLHPNSHHDKHSTPPIGMRVITFELFSQLEEAVTAVITALTNRDWLDPVRIAEELALRNLTADRLIKAYSTKVQPPNTAR